MESWLIFALLAFFFYGMVNVLFKIGAEKKTDAVIVAFVLYLVAGIIALVYYFLSQRMVAGYIVTNSLIIGAAIGVFSLLGTIAVQKAFQFGKGSLVGPIMGVNILMVVLVSLLYYHEKVTVLQGAGIVLAFVSIVLMTI